MHSIGDIIKQARKQKRLTVEQVGQAVGVSKSTVSKWENGSISNMKRDKIAALAQILNISPTLITGCEEPSSPVVHPVSFSEHSFGGTLQVCETCENIYTKCEHLKALKSSYNPTIHKIPVLGYISAGQPLYAEEHIEGYTYTDRNGGAEYFALRVKGDSMNATQINEGNIIIVRKQENVENGEIAVVRVGSENATVKQYKRDGNTVYLIPKSFNPVHDVQTYNLKETNIDVIGKVVECKIEF